MIGAGGCESFERPKTRQVAVSVETVVDGIDHRATGPKDRTRVVLNAAGLSHCLEISGLHHCRRLEISGLHHCSHRINARNGKQSRAAMAEKKSHGRKGSIASRLGGQKDRHISVQCFSTVTLLGISFLTTMSARTHREDGGSGAQHRNAKKCKLHGVKFPAQAPDGRHRRPRRLTRRLDSSSNGAAFAFDDPPVRPPTAAAYPRSVP